MGAINNYLQRVLSGLSSRTPEKMITDDLWRIRHHWLGPGAFVGAPDTSMLSFGGRSGLYALVRAYRNPSETIHVVERDLALRLAIAESITMLGLQNVRLHASCLDVLALPELDKGPVGVVHFDRKYFDRELLTTLAARTGFDYLAGEFSEAKANVLWVHRLSRQVAKNFHWRITGQSGVIAGCRFAGPDVSVVVPAYGVEACLDQCLESLVTQTLDAMEIIVVDDGARDRSGKIADEWARRDARIKVLHQENAGCATSRSNGMRAAGGLFIGFLDGDDWVDPPMYQALAESAIRFSSDIAQCGFRHVYQVDNTREDEREHFQLSHALSPGEGLVANPKALIPLKPSIWRRIYRRDFLEENGLDFARNLRRFDDTPFHFMTLALAQRLSVVHGCYYNYRQQRPGQDIGVADERLYVHFPIFQILKEFVRQHHSRELEEALFKTQVASHYWAASVIEPRLHNTYTNAARYDLFGDNVSLPPGILLKSTRSLGRGRSLWARAMRYRSDAGKDAWMSVKDYAN
ncbi:glycosyltransferase [Methyloparacoccus murrellii]